MRNGIIINGKEYAVRQSSCIKENVCKKYSLVKRCNSNPYNLCDIFRDFGKDAWFVKLTNKKEN